MLDSAKYDNGGANETTLAITDAIGDGNIADDDQPTVSIDNGVPSPAVEGDAPGTITFAVNLTNQSDKPITVTYHLASGTATLGSDFSDAGTGTIVIPANTSGGTITVNVLDNSVFESPEAFTVVLDSAKYDNGGANETTLAITDAIGDGNIADDDQPTVSIDNGVPSPAVEGDAPGTITFAVNLTNQSDKPITVTYHLASGTATLGSDFSDAGTGTIVIPANTSGGTITVNVLDNSVFESPEAFTVVLDSAKYDNGGANETTLAITDAIGDGNIADDDQPTVSIDNGVPSPAVEGDAPGTITFAVNLTNQSDKPITVTYHLASGTATLGSDFSDAGTGTIVIPANTSGGTITVNVLDNSVFEFAGSLHGRARQRQI